VVTGEMERAVVMLQEERLEMCQMILFSEKTPYAVFVFIGTMIKLHGLQCGKLLNQNFVYDKVLYAILARGFVLMCAYSLPEERRHLEMRIAEQGRQSHNGRKHLRVERSATIADQHVRTFALD